MQRMHTHTMQYMFHDIFTARIYRKTPNPAHDDESELIKCTEQYWFYLE